MGAFMEQARRRKGISRERLADAIGVNPKTIYRWERDQGAPGVDDVMAIARELEVSLDELVYGERTFQERAIAEAGRVMREQLPALIAEALKEQEIARGR